LLCICVCCSLSLSSPSSSVCVRGETARLVGPAAKSTLGWLPSRGGGARDGDAHLQQDGQAEARWIYHEGKVVARIGGEQRDVVVSSGTGRREAVKVADARGRVCGLVSSETTKQHTEGGRRRSEPARPLRLPDMQRRSMPGMRRDGMEVVLVEYGPRRVRIRRGCRIDTRGGICRERARARERESKFIFAGGVST
jgi:hypothetical protein